MTTNDWEEEFREYFDKTLKSKKPTMGGLDREICINFIKNVEKEAYERGLKEKIVPTGVNGNDIFGTQTGIVWLSEKLANTRLEGKKEAVEDLIEKAKDLGWIDAAKVKPFLISYKETL